MIDQLCTRLKRSLGAVTSAGRSSARFTVVMLAVVLGASLALLTPGTATAADPPVYEIKSGNAYAGGPRIDVMWASHDPLQGAFLWPDNASLSQEFALAPSSGGYYRIKARHSGQCLILDWRAGSYANGTKVLQHPSCAEGYAPGEWYTQRMYRQETCGTSPCFSTSAWYSLIRNRATGKCLDAANGAGGLPPTRAVLQQWDCIGSPQQWNAWNQLWSFVSPTSVPGPVIR